MARMAIPKIRDDRKSVEYRIRLEPEVDDQLQLYRKLYTGSYGQQIETKELLEPIIRRFLAADRAFQKFKKHKSKEKNSSNQTSATASTKTSRPESLRIQKP